MFNVQRCVQDYDEVYKNTVAEFATEEEADAFVEQEEASSPWRDVWFEVFEE
jgi:hypothetical protein